MCFIPFMMALFVYIHMEIITFDQWFGCILIFFIIQMVSSPSLASFTFFTKYVVIVSNLLVSSSNLLTKSTNFFDDASKFSTILHIR